jgi:hypothetical protein
MMPPDPQITPPAGDVAPYPGSALNIGGGRWLLMTGDIVTNIVGRRCELTSQTVRYWELAALRGQGVPLSELIV